MQGKHGNHYIICSEQLSQQKCNHYQINAQNQVTIRRQNVAYLTVNNRNFEKDYVLFWNEN